MPEQETWRNVKNATAIVAEARTTSVGAAAAALCAACAAGTVRWRDAGDSFAIPIRTQPGLTRRAWSEGHIDFDRAEVVSNGRRYEMVEISASDLRCWLRQPPHNSGAATDPAEATTSPTQRASIAELRRMAEGYVKECKAVGVSPIETTFADRVRAQFPGTTRAAIKAALKGLYVPHVGRPRAARK